MAAFFLLWGAFVYMSAAGNPRQMERGKEAMVNALFGLIIALSARTIAALENDAAGTAAQAAASGDSDLSLILWDMAQVEHLADSQKLAAIVQESLNKALGITDRGVRQAPFRVLVGSTCPSVLVELGFITNPEDEALLSKPDYRDKLAAALHAAVRRYRDSSTP